MQGMDLSATFELSSDIPLLYMPGDLSLYPPHPSESKGGLFPLAGGPVKKMDRKDPWEGKKTAAWVVSNCGFPRDIYVRQVREP